MELRPVREISAEEENTRLVPFVGDNMFRIIVDPVEPEPIGTYIVMVFKIEGYRPDCDGSLMAEIECVDKDGNGTGWTENSIGLYPDSTLVIDHPSSLWKDS